MFSGVFKRYVIYLIIYGFFLVAFGLAFFQMFRPNEEYPNSFEQMFLKMFTMVLGEIELMKIPFYPNGWMRIVEILFFTTFLILMVLVLQNLLNALAIRDTEDMLKVSEEDRLYSVMVITFFWEYFSKFLAPKVLKYFPKKKIYFPVFHEIYRNDETFVGVQDGAKNYEPWIIHDAYSWRNKMRWRIGEIWRNSGVGYVLFKFLELFELYRGLFTISKRVAEDAKEIIVTQSSGVDKVEDVVKVYIYFMQIHL